MTETKVKAIKEYYEMQYELIKLALVCAAENKNTKLASDLANSLIHLENFVNEMLDVAKSN
ncbi:hypothetical protein SAMN02745116_01754 [Pilibacter termitis]|uniref:Uncharacterized protein n=1 Tax=Pilibacter termitis TaxID=263852 RepID=A0A1T4PCD9_9ENTE|nr:hypothetical protein [Pilibacter termitis]SJZ89223.1 hypothetical protein SAMN02745116_01754 [Pilibacter termitis]